MLVMGPGAWMNNHKLRFLSLSLTALSVLALSLRAWALNYPGWTHDLSEISEETSPCIMFPLQLSQTSIMVQL